MILIAHRGNLNGPSDYENNPNYLTSAMYSGYDVEVDVWYTNNGFFLGHDYPKYPVDSEYLFNINSKAWFHAKNIQALFELTKRDFNTFYHNTDDAVLTSHRFLWTYPGKEITSRSIAVLPEILNENWDITNAYGVCTDYVNLHKNIK